MSDDETSRTAPAADPAADPAPGGAPGSPPRTFPEAVERIAALEAALAERAAQNAEFDDRLLRERAELENFKRRMQRERADALRYANEPLLRDLLGVIDNLERALRAARDAGSRVGAGDGALGALAQGVELVLAQFADTLSRHGVSRVLARETAFDPAHHEALAQVETDTHPPGTVLEEHAAGYRLHDRLLRAAQVTVAKAPAGSGAAGRNRTE